MLALPPPPAGSLVRVRQRTYLVEQVHQAPPAAAVVSLACVDDDAQGDRLDVVWAIETDARVLSARTSAARPDARPDDARTFAAYLFALRWAAITSTEADLFQSPLRAGILPQTYQLEPLRIALRLPRVNLFIADDVGLGKTIEAGLVLSELLLRNKIDRVVVTCPAAVVLQWQEEMFERFGLSFSIYNSKLVAACRKERGFRANPWDSSRFFLISHTLLRDPDITAGLRRTLGTFAPRSLFIVDEAHAAAPSSGGALARDSDTTRAVRNLARLFEHRLFLSATPHNGHSGSFSALMEILDPQRFTRHIPVRDQKRLREVLVRRLKSDLEGHTRAKIPHRHVETLEIRDLPDDAPELALASLLSRYTKVLDTRARQARTREEGAARLVAYQLQTRLFSSIEAFSRTLRVHKKSLAKQAEEARSLPTDKPARSEPAGARPPRPQLALFAADADDEHPGTDAEARADIDLDRASSALAPELPEDAAALLDEMIGLADKHRQGPDARVRALLAWLREHACPDLPTSGPAPRALAWKPRKILVFTEFTATLDYLKGQLRGAFGEHEHPDRVLVFDGDTDDEAREQIKAQFNDPAHPVRVLLATDAAREGLNLQKACADLFHFDLPWNPARLEQRNGRIDRLMQSEKEVRCWSFFYAQRPEDRVLRALIRKTHVIRAELGAMADVIDRKLDALLSGGIDRDKIEAVETAIDSIAPARTPEREAELESTREKQVEGQLATLQRLYDKASAHVDLQPERLADVVNLGLQLAGKQPLSTIPTDPDVFVVPPLAEERGADPTWREIEDRLRPPRPKGKKVWEWRAETKPRPVTFHASVLEDRPKEKPAPVLLHLEHALVRRALAPLRSQGFGEDQLSRWTAAVDATSKRHRVMVLARLSVFGPGAARLHEELLTASAFWTAGEDPTRLTVFKTDLAEERAVSALAEVLARPQPPLPEAVIGKLQSHVARDEAALFPQLEERARERVAWATSALAARAEQEAEAMIDILRTQKQSITALLTRTQQLQLPGLLPEDTVQRDADLRYLQTRLTAIGDEATGGELATEPARIREGYTVVHHRLAPVGLVYLWAAAS